MIYSQNQEQSKARETFARQRRAIGQNEQKNQLHFTFYYFHRINNKTINFADEGLIEPCFP